MAEPASVLVVTDVLSLRKAREAILATFADVCLQFVICASFPSCITHIRSYVQGVVNCLVRRAVTAIRNARTKHESV